MESNTYLCHTPVVFIFYNRPECEKKTLAQIAKVRPPKLYLVADGPRSEMDREKTNECRRIAESYINWDCKVEKVYSDTNLGCCNRIYSGITYALNREDQAIILEDDIVPSISFFRFQDEMLDKYKEDERVFSVSGYNEFDYISDGESSFWFVNYFSCWGWGTWSRAWKQADINMKGWEGIQGCSNRLMLRRIDRKAARVEYHNWKKTYYGFTDSWAYRISFWFYEHEKCSIMPQSSLTKNIGVGDDATHTRKLDVRKSRVKANEVAFPLISPVEVKVSEQWMDEFIKCTYHKGYYFGQLKFYIKESINVLFYKFFGKKIQVKRRKGIPRLVLTEVILKKPDIEKINRIVGYEHS